MLALLLLGGMQMFLLADKASALRELLPKLKGEARLTALNNLYQLSLQTDDVDYQFRCLNDLIAEQKRQQKELPLAMTLVERAVMFYNYDMSDSIFK
jgi:hypothetical protein